MTTEPTDPGADASNDDSRRPRYRIRRFTRSTVFAATGKVQEQGDPYPVVKKSTEVVGRAGATAVTKSRDAAARVSSSADSARRDLTLEDYRIELENALDEAIDVVTAQQIEIDVLRQRVQQVEDRAKR